MMKKFLLVLMIITSSMFAYSNSNAGPYRYDKGCINIGNTINKDIKKIQNNINTYTIGDVYSKLSPSYEILGQDCKDKCSDHKAYLELLIDYIKNSKLTKSTKKLSDYQNLYIMWQDLVKKFPIHENGCPITAK